MSKFESKDYWILGAMIALDGLFLLLKWDAAAYALWGVMGFYCWLIEQRSVNYDE